MADKCDDCAEVQWEEWWAPACHVLSSCKEWAEISKDTLKLKELELQNEELKKNLEAAVKAGVGLAAEEQDTRNQYTALKHSAGDQIAILLDDKENLRKQLEARDRLVDSLTKLYKTILENKCVLQDDFNFWHGELLKVQTPEVKRNNEVPNRLAGPTQCGEWTQWGQCIAEKPCKVHGWKRKDECDGHVHVYQNYQCERCGKGQVL